LNSHEYKTLSRRYRIAKNPKAFYPFFKNFCLDNLNNEELYLKITEEPMQILTNTSKYTQFF